MRAPAGRRPQATTPTPVDPWQHLPAGGHRRDSDASYASSRPSSAHSGATNHHRSSSAIPLTDRSYQTHAVSSINSYLSSSSFPVSFRLKPLPSNKDITETLKFVISRLHFPIGTKIEDDVSMVLKFLNCPIKMNKSALKAPGTPHSFPTVLAVLHWLVQVAKYNEHCQNSNPSRFMHEDGMFTYTLDSYLHYINGNDDAVVVEDDNFIEKLQQEGNVIKEQADALAANAKDLEVKLEAMKSAPLPREAKEEEKRVLEKDIEKFNFLIQQLQEHELKVEKELEEKDKALGIKKEERSRICEENEELKKKVEEQGMNIRDAERMKRELQSVEREIGDAETERNKWEDKCWDLKAAAGTKFKELEAQQTESNHAIRRLKLGNDIQYELNAKGTTPAEVLGMDYKTRMEPVLSTISEEVKRSSMALLETQMSLRQQSRDMAAKIDAKRNHIAKHESRCEEVEDKLNVIKNETQDYVSSCAMEARQLVENFEAESRKVDLVEKEAHRLLEDLKTKLEETKMQCEEEVGLCANGLLASIDSVSKYKEITVLKISEMDDAVSETAAAIGQALTDALTPYLGV